MRKTPPRPVSKKEAQAFFLRVVVLCSLMGLVWWVGWRSRWARTDERVVVEAVDAPKASPATAETVEAVDEFGESQAAAGPNAPGAANPHKSVAVPPRARGREERPAGHGDRSKPDHIRGTDQAVETPLD
jgi:hypothetical protein